MTNLNDTQKRLKFRAWHRGTREMDLLLGRFADAHIAAMSADDLTAFEALLAIEDPVLWDYVTGKAAPGAAEITPVLGRFLQFCNAA
jgi:antitoxin CptB